MKHLSFSLPLYLLFYYHTAVNDLRLFFTIMPTSLPLESRQPPKPEVFEAKSNLGFMLHSPLKTSFEKVLHQFTQASESYIRIFAN